MKGWVGMVGWPVADVLPTWVVTRQLLVELQAKFASQRPTFYHCATQCVQHTHTENFYNLATVPKTLTKMLFSHCTNWCQSFLKLSEYPLSQVCQTYTIHVYLRLHEWCDKEYLTWTILQWILILYPLRILALASTFYMNETIAEQQFT